MVILEVILVFYLLLCLARFFVKAIPVALVFPVMPFLCAWEIRKERPFVAWTIVVLWSLLYAVLILMLVV